MTTEHEDVLSKLETMIEKLENLSLQQQAAEPKRQKVVGELITEAQDTIKEIVRWQRRREDEAQLIAVIEAIHRNTETFLKAIDKNTKATNELLAISEARLSQVEQELTDSDDNGSEVDPDILAEAAFLKAPARRSRGHRRTRPALQGCAHGRDSHGAGGARHGGEQRGRLHRVLDALTRRPSRQRTTRSDDRCSDSSHS